MRRCLCQQSHQTHTGTSLMWCAGLDGQPHLSSTARNASASSLHFRHSRRCLLKFNRWWRPRWRVTGSASLPMARRAQAKPTPWKGHVATGAVGTLRTKMQLVQGLPEEEYLPCVLMSKNFLTPPVAARRLRRAAMTYHMLAPAMAPPHNASSTRELATFRWPCLTDFC